MPERCRAAGVVRDVFERLGSLDLCKNLDMHLSSSPYQGPTGLAGPSLARGGHGNPSIDPSLQQRVLALQRLAGNAATRSAIERGGGRALLQRLVMTTGNPVSAADPPGVIAAQYEVDLTARALAGNKHAITHLTDAAVPLDEGKVNYIVGHSDGKKIGGYDAPQLAELLVKRGMKSGMAVRLVGCHTGADDLRGDDVGVARLLAIQLHMKHNLSDVAVKGALGTLIKTKRKGDPDEAGTSGVYTGIKHNYKNALATQQAALMKTLATALGKEMLGANEDQFAAIRGHIDAILRACDSKASVNAERNVVAKQVADALQQTFKRGVSLTATEDKFTAVMREITAIAQGIHGDFEQQVGAATRKYFAACQTIIDTWLRGVRQQPTAKRADHGNITYGHGNTPFFAKSHKYDDVYEGGFVEGPLVPAVVDPNAD